MQTGWILSDKSPQQTRASRSPGCGHTHTHTDIHTYGCNMHMYTSFVRWMKPYAVWDKPPTNRSLKKSFSSTHLGPGFPKHHVSDDTSEDSNGFMGNARGKSAAPREAQQVPGVLQESKGRPGITRQRIRIRKRTNPTSLVGKRRRLGWLFWAIASENRKNPPPPAL